VDIENHKGTWYCGILCQEGFCSECELGKIKLPFALSEKPSGPIDVVENSGANVLVLDKDL
jgi:hypothetical protein